ncbi:speriolin [Carlito syrichta]|uniref:Speriolin n=2 Tax=Carlito syrichta TaxID=1868482 RepID=A0A1U7UDJ3_CARSF|nr:speriolin [Carlito syrichta]
MSLLTNYEGLRHQIEKLVRENDEMKKLVRLIRENQELKSAIKTQAGNLGISGFSTGLGEAVGGSSSHQSNSVFMPASPAAANEPVLDEMGIMALLSNSQSSPTTGSIVSPLSPLSTLLSSLAPASQSSPLTSLLTGPLSTPPGATLSSSLGLPSTGPLTPSSPMAGPMAISQSSPLISPVAGTVPVSLSSPLLSSATAPLGVPQNLVANPMSNVVPSEAPRLRLAEPLLGCPTGPHSACVIPAAIPKVSISVGPPRLIQDPETLSMASVDAPLQTSTPISTMGTPAPATAFTYNTSDTRAQPSAPQGQVVPVSVPASSTASPNVSVLASAPNLAPQAATSYTSPSTTRTTHSTHHSPSRTQHTPTRNLPAPPPPRNPQSPPRASSSPASVNESQGPRTADPSRKSMVEVERKLAHRKISKFPESTRESKQLAWERLVGEIAFQLDRRILSSIFPERVRLYGFTVSNIPEKIIQASLNPSDHKLDEELCQTLTQRYVSIMNRLHSLGYNGQVHPALTEQLVNAYGILRERPELAASEGGSYTVDFLQRVLVETVHPSMLADALLLLSCLNQLAHDDGKPMFIW